MSRDPAMQIEVAYARADRQLVLPLAVAPGTTAGEAVRISGILAHFPEIDPDRCPLGIYGRPCAHEHRLQPGDRVEIYRPLLADPKALRRQRARPG